MSKPKPSVVSYIVNSFIIFCIVLTYNTLKSLFLETVTESTIFFGVKIGLVAMVGSFLLFLKFPKVFNSFRRLYIDVEG